MKEYDELRILEAARDPRYITYLTVIFPRWLSHLPGGSRYDASADKQEQHAQWYMACADLLTRAEHLGIFLDGWPVKRHRYPETPVFAQQYTRRSEIRKLRSKWAKRLWILQRADLIKVWTPTMADDAEWKSFQAYADNFHKKQGLVDV